MLEQRNKYIENHYWVKQQNSKVGHMIRKKKKLEAEEKDEK